MKPINASLLSFLIFASVSIEAAVRSDVVVIEASEGVQYSVQEVAKDYLLAYIYPKKYALKEDMQHNITILDQNIQKIATNTKDKKTKGILSYFSTQKLQMKELINQKSTNESVEAMVSFSEIFSEGSKSIATQHKYPFIREEKMLMLTKEMITLAGAIVKYYISLEIHPHDKSSQKNLEKSINTFILDLDRVNSYTYGLNMVQQKESLNRTWRVIHTYVKNGDLVKVPALLSIASKQIQKILEVLSVYHSKNQ